jgi:hypothetical protein
LTDFGIRDYFSAEIWFFKKDQILGEIVILRIIS